ncbi:unnamed protein product [Didymodactylos carnosus]|uniref:Uncharacterized protein n=1 Tax=Didymodactylos carnosus TaxID=1234261 RepID=A0A815ZR95_9BILA|nr:unnamed protein product [Didymodactylos carnosus]CAF1588648.1 unnamed protein product [Didymodactylos carnosus]CAF4215292.1 unnamed protein product [Didymodactylos carnosus]CAF4459830.1 unnamed protein product [Didymodactylos carnosus]
MKIGGVFIQGPNHLGPNHIEYPVVQFHIPRELQNLDWTLSLYVLTEYYKNQSFFQHFSKGILNNTDTPDSPIDNPHHITLTKDDIERGLYEVRVRLLNITGIAELKKRPLILFPHQQHAGLPCSDTAKSLELDAKKYHLAAVLSCNDRAVRVTVSNLTTEEER